MGSCGAGIGRLIAAVIETHHDGFGIVWPPQLAPFDVHLLALGTDDAVHAQAEAAHRHVATAGLEVLYDDRQETAGVKFADTDLVGCPARVTVGPRSLRAGGVEVKARWAGERHVVKPEGLIGDVQHLLHSFRAGA